MDTHSLQNEVPHTAVVGDPMDTARAIMKLLHEVETLKRLPRSGWQIKKVQHPESVAEHSFRLTVMAFFAPVYLDRARLRDMATVHDFGEIIAGDYTPHDKFPREKKHEQEKLFFQYAMSILPGHPAPKYWMELWQEYEDKKTPEALWLCDADKMESVIQSREYSQRGFTNLEEFLGLIPKFSTSQMATWGTVLHEEIQQNQNQRQRIPIIFVTSLSTTKTAAYSKFLSDSFGALYLSLRDILMKKSSDTTDPHADFATLYLQKGLDTSPIGYMIDLLQEGIDEGMKQGKCCVVIEGFPRSVKQLRGFEEKIQTENLTLLLDSTEANTSDYTLRVFQELEDQQKEKFFQKIPSRSTRLYIC